jgi:2-polyprenyl-3-methyl-5-hydroxy-6-metoxy-1,4-benzoquinol methylase
MSTTAQRQPALSPERIFSSLNAYQLTSALIGAINLDLFTAIDEGSNQSAVAIAERCHASERGCRILCDFLTVHGFLTKNDGQWALTPDSAAFLSRKSPRYMGTIAKFINSPQSMSNFADMAALVRNGGTLWGEEGSVSANNAIWVEFARSMPAMVGGAAQEIGELASGNGQPWRVLDIAAGHGLFGIAIASRNPQASVTALDWAAVLEVAKENAVRAGVQDRVHTVAGSAFDTDLGSGYDVVLLTNFLHHFDRSTNVALLKRVHAALKPGGCAMTLEFVPNPDRISPPIHATFSMVMLGSTRAGDAYTFAELESMFAEAEFASTTMQDLQASPERLLISRP